ncbi:MAG: nitroreductase family deazaflavin-dependent oxidoreductase [Anaerolineales bacterium]|nr:nitroreductase family deazaflavin-dependent oxidoreductase [Anaerolineales bacterium]
MSDVNLSTFAQEDYCYLTTRGRRTGNPHEIEIWFGVQGGSLYLLSGSGAASDWVKNLLARPQVRVRIRDAHFDATARLVEDAAEQAVARRLLAAKYYHWETGKPLNDWASTALPVALDVSATP